MIRSKLYDFEADVSPDDWDVISGRLPGARSVGLRPYRRYGYVAAAAAVLLIAGGMYFYSLRDDGPPAVTAADVRVGEQPADRADGKELPLPETTAAPDNAPKPATASLRRPQPPLAAHDAITVEEEPPVRLNPQTVAETGAAVTKMIHERTARPENTPKITPDRKQLLATAGTGPKRRRWSFGMGGGSYGVNSGSSDVAPTPGLMLRSVHEEYMIHKPDAVRLRNGSQEPAVSLSDNDGVYTRAYEAPTGNVEHKTPLSAGLGVSYYLNDRWSLQSGLTYTLLRSQWDFDDVATGSLEENRQTLHFVGIPLSLVYKIAEWNRFQLYVAAGGMCELNVAGKYTETAFAENLKITNSENIRMKDPLWSASVRAGINYPLWRFVNVYAEAGASYYFDNGSRIKTIRSDKPFNVSLQAGVRLGF